MRIAASAALAFAVPAIAAEPLTIVFSYDREPTAAIRSAIETEVGGILAASAVDVRWRALDASVYKESFARLVVARFHGSCFHPAATPRKENSTLARTEMVDGEILPFSEIDCDSVRAYIGGKLLRAGRFGDALLGRALGRVVAHELYHILAATPVHGHSGVAKRRLSVMDLTAEKLPLDGDEVLAIRAQRGWPGSPSIVNSLPSAIPPMSAASALH